MKTDTKLKIIVYGGYFLLFLLGCLAGFFIFHFSLLNSLILGVVSGVIYPIICIFEAWIGSILDKKKELPPKDK